MLLTIASYNIHRCVGQDRRYDPQRIVSVMEELQADVVAIQEIESREHGGLDLLRWLAAQLGYAAIPGPTLLRAHGPYGNAILTKLEVMRIARLDLSLPGREPRGAVDVDLNCDGRPMHVVATHLGLWPGDRRIQMQRLLEAFKPELADRAVLMGDLNEWFLWASQIRRLQRLFGRTPALRTFPARLPMLPLDRIWVHPRPMLISLKVHDTPAARRASDHLPLKGILLTKC
jgi:endonuclease/exonuclease/phosphatase family metal-dependent hydrolase